LIKTKKCKLCDKNAFSKGFCQQHSPKKSIKNSREQTTVKKEDRSQLREVYFDYHINKCTHSEHSGKPINNPSRTNIAHIVPKGLHPSLQDNLDNFIYLLPEEHERFDKLLFSLEFDKLEKEFGNTCDIIWNRYLKIVDLCKENTKLLREIKKHIDGRNIES